LSSLLLQNRNSVKKILQLTGKGDGRICHPFVIFG
jgi:hypothetical protein